MKHNEERQAQAVFTREEPIAQLVYRSAAAGPMGQMELGHLLQQARARIESERLTGIAARYRAEWLAVMRRKLGLAGESPEDAAKAWLKANPATLERWLTGVTTLTGLTDQIDII